METLPAVWDAFSARAAAAAGARTLFLSGSALAASLGVPDIGLIRPEELLHASARIVEAAELPLIVDVETGYGPLTALPSLIRDLQRVGVTGIHIEDQEFTGQSVSSAPKLCSTATMQARVRVARKAGGDDFIVLARSDVLGEDWPFETTLERLEAYRAAGAQWTMAVFVRSREELAASAGVNPHGSIAIAVPGSSGYIPSAQDASELGCRAMLVTGLSAALFPTYKELYRLALDGALDELRARRLDPGKFADEMGFARYLAWESEQASQ
jgi:2,3-dimethylmalate lyase